MEEMSPLNAEKRPLLMHMTERKDEKFSWPHSQQMSYTL